MATSLERSENESQINHKSSAIMFLLYPQDQSGTRGTIKKEKNQQWNILISIPAMTNSIIRANWLGALQSPKLSTVKRHCASFSNWSPMTKVT